MNNRKPTDSLPPSLQKIKDKIEEYNDALPYYLRLVITDKKQGQRFIVGGVASEPEFIATTVRFKIILPDLMAKTTHKSIQVETIPLADIQSMLFTPKAIAEQRIKQTT
ncbi:MAG: hypothetical protein ACKKL5_01580 [Candidatus Komeilibacteria bacterium]